MLPRNVFLHKAVNLSNFLSQRVVEPRSMFKMEIDKYLREQNFWEMAQKKSQGRQISALIKLNGRAGAE